MLSCLKGCRAGFRAHRLARPPAPRKVSHRSRMGLNTAAASAPGHQCSICVFGAGAVGLYLAAALEKAGLGPDRLSLVCRGSTYEQIKETGHITVKDVPEGTVSVAKNFKLVHTADIGEDFPSPDIVLSCAKGHHLPPALPALQRLVGSNTLLVTIQNGLPFHLGHLTAHPELAGKPLPAVDPGGRLFSTFRRQQVVPGVVYIAAERTAAAEVTSRGLPKNIRFVFGAVHDSSAPHACRSEALEAVVAELSRVGINACIEQEILTTIWRKLLVSACINPTNALTHGPTNALVQSPRTAALVTAMAAEVMHVGGAVGATFEDSPEQWLEACRARFVASKFSMLQDVEAGRQLEVAPLVTSVSDIARELGISCPRLDTVAALIEHYDSNIVAGDAC